MRVLKDYPPNYKAICKRFPTVKKMDSAIFTYGQTVYVPKGGILPSHLMVHESTHAEIQAHMTPEKWWERYLKDDDFRREQEVMAYQRQYKHARKRFSKAALNMLLDKLAADLSGDMYGGIYDLDEAKELIKGKYK